MTEIYIVESFKNSSYDYDIIKNLSRQECKGYCKDLGWKLHCIREISVGDYLYNYFSVVVKFQSKLGSGRFHTNTINF